MTILGLGEARGTSLSIFFQAGNTATATPMHRCTVSPPAVNELTYNELTYFLHLA
jgi:hypothetical protein